VRSARLGVRFMYRGRPFGAKVTLPFTAGRAQKRVPRAKSQWCGAGIGVTLQLRMLKIAFFCPHVQGTVDRSDCAHCRSFAEVA